MGRTRKKPGDPWEQPGPPVGDGDQPEVGYKTKTEGEATNPFRGDARGGAVRWGCPCGTRGPLGNREDTPRERRNSFRKGTQLRAAMVGGTGGKGSQGKRGVQKAT